MLQKLKEKQRQASGFTIIEVMIVLAIAGLIMVIVFLAVPQLQRSQRNTARKDVVGRIKAEFENYASNNNGKYPATAAEVTGFKTRYLSNVSYDDPSTGTPITLTLVNNTTAPGAVGTLNIHSNNGSGFSCSGETVVTGAGGRAYAMTYFLEGGAIYCVDNR